MELIEVWSDWWDGGLDERRELWGISLLWWGRIGLLSQYLAALTILVEIVGPKRLRRLGSDTRRSFNVRKAIRFVWGTIKWGTFFVSHATGGDGGGDNRQFEQHGVTGQLVIIVTTLIAMGIGTYTFVSNWNDAQIILLLVFSFLVAGASLVFMAVLVSSLAVAGAIAVVVANITLIQPLAYCLEQPALNTLAKIISVLLVTIGIHFSLLTA